MIEAGLRIDVDTLRGTCRGVPGLLEILEQEGLRASFFFSVGPDNMGRHLWRLFKPAFLLKMLRTRATSLYGWDILFKGTFWPGPLIGRRCRTIIHRTAATGHEIGLHAWDHHGWQSHCERWNEKEFGESISRGYATMVKVLESPPVAFAAPAWRITETGLTALSRFPFSYVSNCRGERIFRPHLSDSKSPELHLEIPTTLPTYDEVVGKKCTPETWNDYLLNCFRQDGLNVLTIHAEVEGICARERFRDFLKQARQHQISFHPLGALLPSANTVIPSGSIIRYKQSGREGWISIQQ